MSEPYLSEIRMFGFNFAPRGWAQCDGQLLPINQNQSLFSLLGTTYGGDGRTDFALPDLRSRSPRKDGDHGTLGQHGGAETVTLNASEMPRHTHNVRVNTATNTDKPEGNYIGTGTPVAFHPVSGANQVGMFEGTVDNFGGGQSHDNMQPYETVNFCIALQGLFPPRN